MTDVCCFPPVLRPYPDRGVSSSIPRSESDLRLLERPKSPSPAPSYRLWGAFVGSLGRPSMRHVVTTSTMSNDGSTMGPRWLRKQVAAGQRFAWPSATSSRLSARGRPSGRVESRVEAEQTSGCSYSGAVDEQPLEGLDTRRVCVGARFRSNGRAESPHRAHPTLPGGRVRRCACALMLWQFPFATSECITNGEQLPRMRSERPHWAASAPGHHDDRGPE